MAPALAAQRADGRTVEFRRLRKVYGGGGGSGARERVAVARLTLSLFEGQLTALLGHNGAGKSTAIACLTGLVPPSAGDCLVRGRSVSRELAAARASLGVCPQHDVLFPELTPLEHLLLFAVFKARCIIIASA